MLTKTNQPNRSITDLLLFGAIFLFMFGNALAGGLQTFNVAWSGVSFGNTAVATGQITVDMALLENPGSSWGSIWVSSFSISVSGAATGNGVWNQSHFNDMRFRTGSVALDFSRELVGQNGWATVLGGSADFSISGPQISAPRNTSAFTIRTNGGMGQELRLTSFTPVLAKGGITVGREFSGNQGQGVNERVYALREDSQGRILVGGLFYLADGDESGRLARFLPTGQRDVSFDVGSSISGGTYTYITDIAVLPDDSVVAVGDFTSYNGAARGRIVKVDSQGTIDASFASGLGANGLIRCIERLADGKFLIGGQFSEYDGISCPGLVRLHSNGTLDNSFETGTGFGYSSDYVDQLQLLDDGTFLIAGRFASYDGHNTSNIARLLSTGRVDPTFQSNDTFVSYMETLKLGSDGKILVGGSGGWQMLYRLQANGAIDTAFNPDITGWGVYGVHEMPDGKLLVGGDIESSLGGFSKLIMLNSDGSVSTDSFLSPANPNGWVGPMLSVSGGRILIGGWFNRIGSVNYGHLAKLSTNPAAVNFQAPTATMVEGTSQRINININNTAIEPVDLYFSLEADSSEALPRVDMHSRLTLYPGEQTAWVDVYAINDDSLNGPRTFRLRMRSGSPSFIVGAPDFVTVTLQDDEIAGSVFLENTVDALNEGQGGLPIKIRRYLNDPGVRSVRVRSVDGTALAGRDYQAVDSIVNFPAGVYEQTVIIGGPPVSPEGNPIRTFTLELSEPGPGTILGNRKTCRVSVNDRDDPGSSAVAYTVPDPTLLVRMEDHELDADGVLHTVAMYRRAQGEGWEARILKFSNSGVGNVLAVVSTGNIYQYIQAMDIGPDGKIYVCGRDVILRYHRNGTLDTSWTNPFSSYGQRIHSLLCLPDGKVMIAGNIIDPIGGHARKQVVRLLPNGAVDPTFDLGVILPNRDIDWIYDLAVDATGRLLISGNIDSIQGIPRKNVARLLPNGGLDTSFDASAAIASQDDSRYTIRVLPCPDGKIYLVNEMKTFRVHSSGDLDASFTPIYENGLYSLDVAVQPDGKVICHRNNLKRYDSTGTPDLSFSPYGTHSGNFSRILLGPDGRIHLSGEFSKVDGQAAPCIATLLGGSGSAAGTIEWDTAPVAVGEGVGRATAVLRRDSTQGSVGVHYALIPETTAIGSDVASFSGYHQFVPGEAEHLVEFDVLDDVIIENTEIFRLVLHHPSGGALVGPATNLPYEIVDDDGPEIGNWLARFFPRSPLDQAHLFGDPDQDGMNSFAEWMSNSDPTNSSDAKRPVAAWSNAEPKRFGISFYLDPSKSGFRTIVEQSPSLSDHTWSIIWDSSADPLYQSTLIAERPSEGAGWMTVLSTDSTGSKEFLRVRFER